jgi:Uma2 family endonuclease
MLHTMFDSDALAPDAIRKLSRREYDKLVALGVFEDERVELLRGMLVTMSPQGAPHAAITAWLLQRLSILLGMDFDVRGHSPYAAANDSEPEPDISVSRRVAGPFEHPSEALLVVEVAASSIRKDRDIKAAIYADAGVPEYWIVDLSGTALFVEVHTQPTAHGYRHVDTLRDGDKLRPVRLPEIVIPIVEIPWPR